MKKPGWCSRALSYLPGTTATDIASAKDRSFTLGFMPGSFPREQRARAQRWTSAAPVADAEPVISGS